jgi:3-oxoacyl-[acyl-carrier-protein] synthase-3
MFINNISAYLPPRVVPNSHFEKAYGISTGWIEERCGVVERRRCDVGENTNTMGCLVVDRLLEKAKVPRFDLIIGATYTPYDTVGTLAHSVQRHLGISDIPTMTVTTACSSVLCAVEIAYCYFSAGRATRALIVASEHNSAYQDDADPQSGPLWGDGAVAFDVSKESEPGSLFRIHHIYAGGAACTGKSLEAVYLRPKETGIPMVHGSDVFMNACAYMEKETRHTLDLMNWSIGDIAYFVPHQANLRISLRVAKSLGLPREKLVSNVQTYGNTGCCGFGIGLAEILPQLRAADKVVATVFGGGYSYGCMALEHLSVDHSSQLFSSFAAHTCVA